MIEIRITYTGKQFEDIDDVNVKEKLNELKATYEDKLSLFAGNIEEYNGYIRIELNLYCEIIAVGVSGDSGIPDHVAVKLCRYFSY